MPLSATSNAARLTADQVVQARKDYASGVSLGALSQELGVTRQALLLAVTGKTWGHLPGANHRPRVGRRAKFDDHTTGQVRERAARGDSLALISRECSISRETVRRMVRGTGAYGAK